MTVVALPPSGAPSSGTADQLAAQPRLSDRQRVAHGGHLARTCVVELTIGLHRVFRLQDTTVFDGASGLRMLLTGRQIFRAAARADCWLPVAPELYDVLESSHALGLTCGGWHARNTDMGNARGRSVSSVMARHGWLGVGGSTTSWLGNGHLLRRMTRANALMLRLSAATFDIAPQ